MFSNPIILKIIFLYHKKRITSSYSFAKYKDENYGGGIAGIAKLGGGIVYYNYEMNQTPLEMNVEKDASNLEYRDTTGLITTGKESKHDKYVYLLDVYPTLCNLCDVEIPSSVEGKSFADIFSNSEFETRSDLYFAFQARIRGISDGKYKLIEYRTDRLKLTQLFDLENGSNFRKLVSGLAFALVYVWQLILDMQKALNPLHTDNIDEWEKELNLPEVGVAPQDDDGRRRELYRVWGSKGGCNINYYRKLIALLGIDATIFEYTKNPERFVGYVFPENAIPQYYLMIRFKIHQQEFSYFTAGVSGAGDRVMDFTDNFLESIFEKSRQAHIKIAYSYLTEEYVNLVTNDGKKFVTSDGKKLIGFQFME